MKQLSDYLNRRGKVTTVRILKTDKPRLDELQRRLTVAAGGQPFNQQQVLEFLLDNVETLEKFLRQEPPE